MDFYQLVVPDALNLEGETREASPEVTYLSNFSTPNLSVQIFYYPAYIHLTLRF